MDKKEENFSFNENNQKQNLSKESNIENAAKFKIH